jgi:2-aminoadipate transaminase
VIIGVQTARGISTTLEQLVVTTGSQQGLDLVGRVLFDPGDVVLVELPSYVGAISAFQNLGPELVGVEQDRDGVTIAALDATLARLRAERRRVKALYVVPNFQNPTGLLVGLERRRALLEWASRENLLIIEDDPYGDLYFEDVASAEGTRPIAADDRDGRVIYLSSFSKTLAPGFRTAWISAPPPIAAKLELAKQSADLCTGGLDQRMIAEACRRGVLARQLPVLRARYQAKRDVMTRALEQDLPGQLEWEPPRGGFFLWTRLPAGLDAPALLAVAQRHGVIFVTGDAFFVNGGGSDFIRLAFSGPTPERIQEGVRRLAAAFTEAASARSASPERDRAAG